MMPCWITPDSEGSGPFQTAQRDQQRTWQGHEAIGKPEKEGQEDVDEGVYFLFFICLGKIAKLLRG